MKKIFISYRRSDSNDTHSLAKFLSSEFGNDNIFFDTESIGPGVHWPDSIKNSLMHADLMLLIIGPDWLHTQDQQSGRRRIDMDTDWVRLEIITFLQLKEKNNKLLLIPVLVNGATMPKKNYLDSSLAAVCDLTAIELHSKSSFDFDPVRTYLLNNGCLPIYPHLMETTMGFPLPEKLTKSEEDKFLKKYKYWKIIDNEKPGASGIHMRELYRYFEFANYDEAWKFITRVDAEAIRLFNHHPRWQNTNKRVEFWLCTFNIGHQPSQRDIRLAKMLEKIWADFN